MANARRKRTRRPRGRNSPLYTSVRPLVQVARLFGFVPYEFSPQGRLAPSNAYPILSAIAAALYSYILYMVLQRFTSVKRERPVLGGTEYAKVSQAAGREGRGEINLIIILAIVLFSREEEIARIRYSCAEKKHSVSAQLRIGTN